jgi:transcriptional regulator with XRE-family HTH domain
MVQQPEAGTLGDFLHASRSRLSPDDVGLAAGFGRRQVPGLRREEIAMLAGVSASYYTRLEQGQAGNASPQVIDALARALRLADAERDHLHALARAHWHRATAAALETEERVDPALAELLANLPGNPAMVVGRRRDILAWNPAGHQLFAGHLEAASVDDPARRPNATELVFLDARTRELYIDWEVKARASVGHLRMLAAMDPGDPALLSLIGRLTVESAEFAALWATNQIRTSATAVYRMLHPLVGRIDVTQQLLTSSEASGQTVIVCTAPPGSATAGALRMLVDLAEGG